MTWNSKLEKSQKRNCLHCHLNQIFRLQTMKQFQKLFRCKWLAWLKPPKSDSNGSLRGTKDNAVTSIINIKAVTHKTIHVGISTQNRCKQEKSPGMPRMEKIVIVSVCLLRIGAAKSVFDGLVSQQHCVILKKDIHIMRYRSDANTLNTSTSIEGWTVLGSA